MKLNFLKKTSLLFLSCALLFTFSCSKKIHQQTVNYSKDPIIIAEKNADVSGRAILEVGRKMALTDKTIVKGSCWDYINEVFKRAGYGSNKKVVYKSKKSGPYVNINTIKPGDWLYYINHSYGRLEHSGIFVYWKDYKNKIGVTLSYGGENRNEPGRYRDYDLKSVYYITRAGIK